MKIDVAELRNIDFNDVGKWPIIVKIIAVILLSGGVLGAGLWFDTRNQLEELNVAEEREVELKDIFRAKQSLAANLDLYNEQMLEMQRSFGAMLRQLPSKTEVEDLLVDVSQTGLKNGLKFDLFKPESETPVEFYAELPITIKVTGTYHEFGKFVSDVAALPRIVTLHDFTILPATGSGKQKRDILALEATAKTYRYLEEDELEQEDEEEQ